jgi:hypothetical protein
VEGSVTERIFTDVELMYAATARCEGCHAGLAYPLDHEEARKLSAWACSRVLKGEVPDVPEEHGKHSSYPWAFYKVREETSINNRGGYTTRPAGTVARTVGKAKCPKCSHTWESEPYSACGASHHWFSGPCPSCGYAVGADGTHRSGDGEPIEMRYRDDVRPAEPVPA